MSAFQPVCQVTDIPMNTAKRFVVDGTAVAVVRTLEGVFAINDRCSHADVSLAEGEVDGCSIECWLHGSAFDLRTGIPLSMPAITPVATYAVRVSSDQDDATIEIDLTPLNSTATSSTHTATGRN